MNNQLRIIILVLSLIFFPMLNAQWQLTNLPTIYITTDDGKPVERKDLYQSGNITIVSSVASENINILKTEIRGRGNSTWGMAKKPYRLKLDKKESLLGLPAVEKNWVLLANYADKTLMRNAVAFKVSKLVGLEFTPSARFVDLVLNGAYLGTYMLTDQIEVAAHRVPVEEQEESDTTPPTVTGGYLLEIDGFANGEPVWFSTPRGLSITVKYPKDDEINPEQLAYITNFTNNFERLLFSPNFKDPDTGYRALVDSVSLINWYIGCELTGNSDSFWSTYIYKKRSDDKFYFGPMWDYDIAFNNDLRLGDAVNKLMRNEAHQPLTWIQRLWQDEWFRQSVERRWKELIDEGIENQLVSYITETETLLQTSQEKNFEKWNILNWRVYNEQFLFSTYKGGVDYLRQYIKGRIAFLSNSFIVPEPEKPTEPFVAQEFYYRIQNRLTNNAIDVTNDSREADVPLMMWEPAENDEGQLWQIESLGNEQFRFINKMSGLAMTDNGRDRNLIQTAIDEFDINQHWQIVPLFTGGLYGIVNVASGLSVNNSGGNFANGNRVIAYDNNITLIEKQNQHWYLNKGEEILFSEINPVSTPDFSFYVKDQAIHYNNVPANSTVRLYNLQAGLIFEKKSLSGTGQIDISRQGVFVLFVATPYDTYKEKICL